MMTSAMSTPIESASAGARGPLRLRGTLLAGWAPGRVNLIGEHTDYNEGFVLPIAIERVVAMVGQRHQPDDQRITLYSVHHDEMATFTLDQVPDASHPGDTPLWARYVAGVVGELRDHGLPIGGFSSAIAGDVPLGAGMSSSAALIVAALTWIRAAFGANGQAPLALARIGQAAETRGSGVRVGILDQAASILGQRDHATLIDCRDLTYRSIPFHLPDIGLLICETGVQRSLTSSAYNQRVAECGIASDAFAEALRAEGNGRMVRSLRDIDWHTYLRLAGAVPAPARQRARHVISENARTLAAVAALEGGDAAAFGGYILESHASLRDDYAVSCPELDAVVAIATSVPGVLGARLVGAGFGGGALIVARNAALEPLMEHLRIEYPHRTGLTPLMHLVTPADGPGVVELPD